MTMKLSRDCLVLVMGKQLQIAMVAASESRQLLVGSDCFHDQGQGSFMGFHDWLRVPSSAMVVGVRFWPHERRHFQDLAIMEKPYLNLCDDEKCIEIFFYSDKRFECQLSGDQSFNFNKVMLSDNNDAALILDTDDLNQEEFESIRKIGLTPVSWLPSEE